MDDFTKALKKRVDQAVGLAPSWGDVNPLVVIGLTEAILDLGLNEDQIYSVIHSYGRQLAAQVHPDRGSSFSPERQRAIMAAFDAITDRAQFALALAEFRNLRAEERHEVHVLGETVATLRRQVAGMEEQASAIAKEKETLGKERAAFALEKQEDLVMAPVLRDLNATLTTQNESLTRERDIAQGSSAAWKTRFENMFRFVGEMGDMRETPHPFAFQARWVAVVVLGERTEAEGWQEALQSFTAKHLKKSDLVRILKGWETAKALLGKPEGYEGAARLLEVGIFWLRLGETIPAFGALRPMAGRVIGSLPPESSTVVGLPPHREFLSHNVNRDKIGQIIVPRIVPGGFLASVSISRNPLASPRFDTKKFILAVG